MSLHGQYLSPPSEQHIIQSWKYTGNDIPLPDNERIHINLWKYKNSPLIKLENQVSSITINKFMFQAN